MKRKTPSLEGVFSICSLVLLLFIGVDLETISKVLPELGG